MRRSRILQRAAFVLIVALCVPIVAAVSAGAVVTEGRIIFTQSRAGCHPANHQTIERGVKDSAMPAFAGHSTGPDRRHHIRHSDAIAIKTEHFPDSPNQPHFPSTVLRHDETFRLITAFAFFTDKEPIPR